MKCPYLGNPLRNNKDFLHGSIVHTSEMMKNEKSYSFSPVGQALEQFEGGESDGEVKNGL